MDFPLIIALVISGICIAVGWAALRPWYDFMIVVRDGEVSFKGRFPPEKRAAAIQFFAGDLALPGRYRVLGRWGPKRVLGLRFRGDFPRFSQQRVRNFLAMTLRSGG
jgi:hypothetical protein